MSKYGIKQDVQMEKDTVYHKMQKNAHNFLLAATVLIAVAIMWFAAPLGYNNINNEKNAIFENKWKYSINAGEFREVELPDSKSVAAGSHVTLKNKLPKENVKGATVLVRTSQQDVAVYVDGENIYSSYDMEQNIPSPSSAYHFVRLPTQCDGGEITIVLSSPYGNYAGFMNQIHIGSKASNVFFLLGENGFRAIIGFSISGLGFLLMAMFLFVGKQNTNKATFIYLGAFFVCAGYWVMVESKMVQFIFPYPVALTNSSLFALSLLPVFSGLYYYKTHAKKLKKAGKIVFAVVAVASLLFSLAACINPALPLKILPFYLALMGMYVIVLFASIVVEGVHEGKFFSISIYGVIAFGTCCLVELTFYLTNMSGYNNSTFLTLGLLLFCIAMVIDSVQGIADMYQATIKVNTLSVLAYTDSLTDLKNRTAFLESMSSFDVGSGKPITLAMFDLNNLKVVNDTLGHLVGDAMLRHSTKVMKSSLKRGDELYRIGGDEFVAVIRNESAATYKEMEKKFLETVESENKKQLSYVLSIAYGYATFSSDIDKTLFETLSRADEKMYACKKIQKEC